MRTAAYCRFSSDQQREASIRDQLRNIEAYCTWMGWLMPALYQDQAQSGSRNDRPGYQAMLGAAELKAFDVLLVDDLSRLSRDHIETAQTIRVLKFAGIRVIGVSDGTDTARDGYKLETGLRGLMSEYYLDDLAKKTHRGLMGQALAGYSAGGMPYGYKSVNDGTGFKRMIDPEQAEWVRYIFRRYADGAGYRAIACELNAAKVPSPRGTTWAHSALYPDGKGVGLLGNPLYNGRQIWNRTYWTKDPMTGRRRRNQRPQAEWVITEHPDLKIVDDDLWAAVEARIRAVKRGTTERKASNGRGAGGRGPKYLFSGLLRCGVCGGSFVLTERDRYGCACHKDRGDVVCTNKSKVRRQTVERVLLERVKAQLLTPDACTTFEREVRDMLKKAKPDSNAARQRLASAQKEVENIMLAIKAGIVTASTKTALQDAEQAVADAKAEIDAIARWEPTQILPRAKEIYRDMVGKLESIEDVASAREVLRQLIGEVKLIPENGTLTAEMQSPGLAGALQITLVAGTGFEPVTFGL